MLTPNALKWMSNTGKMSLWESGEVVIGQEESLFLILKGWLSPVLRRKGAVVYS